MTTVITAGLLATFDPVGIFSLPAVLTGSVEPFSNQLCCDLIGRFPLFRTRTVVGRRAGPNIKRLLNDHGHIER